MTQEDEKLLLIDLAARVPYEVKISLELDEDKLIGTLDAVYPSENRVIVDNLNKAIAAINVRCGGFILNENDVKPYLRPMSSMTEDECKYCVEHFGIQSTLLIGAQKGMIMPMEASPMFIDWLNAHHFDYRGLIEKGLALEAINGMYDEQL